MKQITVLYKYTNNRSQHTVTDKEADEAVEWFRDVKNPGGTISQPDPRAPRTHTIDAVGGETILSADSVSAIIVDEQDPRSQWEKLGSMLAEDDDQPKKEA